ncbi:MAG: hypothetical protein Kow00121_62830 [Elainellaceae cyanobacterium]
MVTVVLVINLAIALAGFVFAWRIWQFRLVLAQTADDLAAAERRTHRVLHCAPQFILKGQLGSYRLRYQYRYLTLQLQMVQKILMLLGFGQSIWLRYERGRRQQASQPESFDRPVAPAKRRKTGNRPRKTYV